MDQTFGKKYKLCSKKQIDEVFKAKRTVKNFPFIVQFSILPLATPFQVTLAVPKRSFKKAVDRNRIKRLMRESIRLNKLPLENFLLEQNRQLALFVIYIAKEELPFSFIEKKMIKVVKSLILEMNQNHDNES